LHPLVPYFSQLVAETAQNSLASLESLSLLLAASRALISNPHLYMEPYLHQLMPAILTCLVGKSLGVRNAQATASRKPGLHATAKD
jgi:transcription initiation factor TFIID subunit 6